MKRRVVLLLSVAPAMMLGVALSVLVSSCVPAVQVASPSPSASSAGFAARTFDLPDATTLPSTDAWTFVRAALPASVPVLRPTEFPSDVRSDVAELLYARKGGDQWFYAVRYYGATATSGFTVALGPVNSANPKSVEPTTVRGQPATLAQSDGSPRLMIFWRESGYLYTVFANDMTKDDILRVAQSVRP